MLFAVTFQSAAYSWLFSQSVMSDSLHLHWTAAHQAPPSMGFPRQECWSGLPFPSPHILGTLYLTQHLSCSLYNSSCSFSYKVTKYTNSTFFFLSSNESSQKYPRNARVFLISQRALQNLKYDFHSFQN